MITRKNKWDFCIDHYGQKVFTFFEKHLKDDQRKCLYIGGAGFDPRSTVILEKLSPVLSSRLEAFLIKEERPSPTNELVEKADQNLKRLCELVHKVDLRAIDIFANDNAVVGGINISNEIKSIQFEKYTDVIVDLSALSVGVSFPIVAFIYEKIQKTSLEINLHVTTSSNYPIDFNISSTSIDRVSDIRGFSTRDLIGEGEKAKLWLPLISSRKKDELNKIHNHIGPHDTCPIIPFPSEDPKKGDNIILEFISEIENEWDVDTRNFIYADENKPLDIYRTIIRMHNERKLVFEEFGGSVLILSPLGDRMPALGMLMAALEYRFPVVYIETLEYHVKWENLGSPSSTEMDICHIWLDGEAYYSN